jgi:hypothetical protein
MRFSTSDFFNKQLPLGNSYMDLSLFEYSLEFAKIFDYEIADFQKSGVNDRCAQNWRSQKSKIFVNPKP